MFTPIGEVLQPPAGLPDQPDLQGVAGVDGTTAYALWHPTEDRLGFVHVANRDPDFADDAFQAVYEAQELSAQAFRHRLGEIVTHLGLVSARRQIDVPGSTSSVQVLEQTFPSVGAVQHFIAEHNARLPVGYRLANVKPYPGNRYSSGEYVPLRRRRAASC